jgi:hypothetical protein
MFTGITNAFGQAKPYVMVPSALPDCITAQALSNCTADALHPIQGETYDYTVVTSLGTDIVRWFVLNNTTMETAGDSLVSSLGGVLVSTNTAIDAGDGTDDYLLSVVSGTYNGSGDAATTNATIQLKWKYFDGIAEEILLVAYVEGADGCTDNIAVYRIIPEPGFTIDIASVLEDGSNPAGPSDALNSECVSPVESAVYNGSSTTPDGTLTVDYGENWVFFVVNGANYYDSWLPQLEINYDQTAPLAVEAQWTYLSDATSSNWYDFTGALGGTWTTTDPVIAGASYATAGTAGFSMGERNLPTTGGECIVVRVRLDWGTDVEHDTADGTLTVAVDGIAFDGVGSGVSDYFDDTDFADLHYDDCTADGFTNDVVNYTITPRPQVDAGAPVQESKTGDTIN